MNFSVPSLVWCASSVQRGRVLDDRRPVGRRLQVDLDDARIGRDLQVVQARIRLWRRALDEHGHSQSPGSFLDLRDEVEVGLGRRDRRHEYVETPFSRLDTERRLDHAGGRYAALRLLHGDRRPRLCSAAARISAHRKLTQRWLPHRKGFPPRERVDLEHRLGLFRRGPRQRVERQAISDRRIAGDEEEMLGAHEPRSAHPCGRARFVAALDRQHVADDLVEPLLEYARQAGPIFFVLQLRLERVDVHRQSALSKEVVPDILVGRDDMCGVDAQHVHQGRDELVRVGVTVAIVDGVVRDELLVHPDGDTVATPPAAERPARKGLARIPLPLAEVEQRAGRESNLSDGARAHPRGVACCRRAP